MGDQATKKNVIDRMQAWAAVADVVVIAARAMKRSAFVRPARSLG
jgi:hypothetical protein